jgi:hypothetical protein
MTVYDDGSNNYGLIRFNLQAAIARSPDKISLSEAEGAHKMALGTVLDNTFDSTLESEQDHSSKKLIAAGAEQSDSFFVDKQAAYITSDQFGFISQVSAAAESLFVYSN